MNNELFALQKAKVGDVVWQVPIRFWEPEDYSPVRCTVMDDPYMVETGMVPKENDRSIYVFHEEYGHPVYLEKIDCYYSEESARKAMNLLTKLKELRNDDDFDGRVKPVLYKQIRDKRKAP